MAQTQTQAARETERQHRDAFLAAVALALRSIDRKELRISLTSRNIEEIIKALRFDIFTKKFSEIKSAKLNAMASGSAWAAIDGKFQTPLDFSGPGVSTTLDTDTSETITQISNATKAAMTLLVASLLEQDVSPSKAVRKLMQSYGLSREYISKLSRFESALRETVSDPALRESRLDARSKRFLAERATKIASNESFKSFQAGKDALWFQLLASGDVKSTALRKWVTAADEMVCPVCRPMNGQVSPVGGTFTTGNGNLISRSPAHTSCRCSVILIS
jgi:hypothetical protein